MHLIPPLMSRMRYRTPQDFKAGMTKIFRGDFANGLLMPIGGGMAVWTVMVSERRLRAVGLEFDPQKSSFALSPQVRIPELASTCCQTF